MSTASRTDHGSAGHEGPGIAGWRVMRQDDNGNRFEVERAATRADAERIAQRYEARGHKQIYWVEAC